MTLPTPIAPCIDLNCAVHGYGLSPTPGTEEAKHTNLDAFTPRCARQVLRAYDRAGAIALLEREVPTKSEGAHFMIPIAHEMVQPGQRVELGAIPDANLNDRTIRVLGFHATRLDVSAAMHEGWVINDILLDGVSQLGEHRDLPAALFSPAFPNLRAFRHIPGESQIRVIVTRTGALPSPFYSVMHGLATTRRRLSDGQVAELVAAWDRIVQGKQDDSNAMTAPPEPRVILVNPADGFVPPVPPPARPMIVKQMGHGANYDVPDIQLTPNPDGTSTERIRITRRTVSAQPPIVNIEQMATDEGGFDVVTIIRDLAAATKPAIATTE